MTLGKLISLSGILFMAVGATIDLAGIRYFDKQPWSSWKIFVWCMVGLCIGIIGSRL